MAREQLCEVELDRRHQFEVALALMADGWRVCNGTRRYPDVDDQQAVVLGLRSTAAADDGATAGVRVASLLEATGVNGWRIRSEGVAPEHLLPGFTTFALSLDGDAMALPTIAYLHETPEEVRRRCADALGVSDDRLEIRTRN